MCCLSPEQPPERRSLLRLTRGDLPLKAGEVADGSATGVIPPLSPLGTEGSPGSEPPSPRQGRRVLCGTSEEGSAWKPAEQENPDSTPQFTFLLHDDGCRYCASLGTGSRMGSKVEEEALGAPLGGLPKSERVLLRSAQIEVALVEVRFHTGRTEVTSEEGLNFRSLLKEAGVDLPRLQAAQQQQVSLNIGPAGATSGVEVHAKGWQLASEDGYVLATVLPDAVVVQTTKYARWSTSLRPALEALLRAAVDVLNPDLVQRVGIRYVNRLVDEKAQSPTAWVGRIHSAALGPITDSILGPMLETTQQQIELILGGAQGAIVRHGAFRDAAARGKYSYLLDIDVFDGQSNRFDNDRILLATQRLNRSALSLFQHLVLPEYREQMEPYTEEGE